MTTKPVLVIHGGAIYGEEDYDPALDAEYRAALRRSLNAGYEILENGGPALDGVEAAVRELEDCGLFDAGRGAVFTSDGRNELDASIMDGATKKAGAVAGINKLKHPITAARKVMEETWHVLLIGAGAEKFGQQFGLEMVDPTYFFNERKYQQYLKLKENEEKAKKHETVGAVALDKNGNLAAGTSTGGLEMKHWGRVGDSPIIGAGTYADNTTCAISGTGEGEFFIRTSAAFNVHALMKYRNMDLVSAGKQALADIETLGGSGGLVGVTPQGTILLECTTGMMFRGVKTVQMQGVAIRMNEQLA
ncbi:MAG: isoaspartyl peptidase/L-asparaginase [Patescibacteria group bacterium]|nr:isoaspartyl peptidase/L-asparaginase [Patescibacteria group bacterium]